MLKYNICFIKRGHEFLLLNREFPSWMGCWNGIGGKLEQDESPLASMQREIREETNLRDYTLTYKGIVTWTSDGAEVGGMYLYLAEIPLEAQYDTPIKMPEGILDWKSRDWILHPKNVGISSNIPLFLTKMIEDPKCYDYHCTYEEGRLIRHVTVEIDRTTEDRDRTNAYLTKYVM